MANSGQLMERSTVEDRARARQERLVSRRKTLRALAGGSLTIPGAILTAMETGPWFLWGYSVPGMILLALGGWQILKALR